MSNIDYLRFSQYAARKKYIEETTFEGSNNFARPGLTFIFMFDDSDMKYKRSEPWM